MKKIFITLILFFSTLLYAQEVLKSFEEEYYDYISLIGIVNRPALGYRTLSDSIWYYNDTEINHPWKNNLSNSDFLIYKNNTDLNNFFYNGFSHEILAKVLGPELFISYNNAVPYGQNDGALWQGVGFNTSLSGGFCIYAYGLEFFLKPQISFSQNKEFHFTEGVYGSPYSYYTKSGGNIDLVQRYGSDKIFNYDWGNSEIRYSFYTFTIGFGTSNPWIGPAYLNPMLGSNNAGAFPKIDFGFRKTRIVLPFNDFYLGDFEARTYIGKLSESDYFDLNPDNNSRMITALFVNYSPSFIQGFTIGANRIILSPWKTESLKYYARLFTLSDDNDVSGSGEDQKISLTFDFNFPKVGYEVYFEYGMDDFTSDISANPFHTGIYTVGMKKDIPLWKSAANKNCRSELIFEYNNFEMSQDFQLQWQYGGYYTHGKINQGYTQKGQILGAGSGYFGNSQFIKYIVYYPKGSISLFIQRSCPNNNYIYNKAVIRGITGADQYLYDNFYTSNLTYIDAGISSSYFVTRNLILSGSMVYDYVHNWENIRGNDIQNNFHLELDIKYNF